VRAFALTEGLFDQHADVVAAGEVEDAGLLRGVEGAD